MLCPKCQAEASEDAERCQRCGTSLAVAVLEAVRGHAPERIHFLRPRDYSVGRSRQSDLCLTESSVSKTHARLRHDSGRFSIEDADSTHGVYVDGLKVSQAPLANGSEIQLGNVTLKLTYLGDSATTASAAPVPWIERQQLLLSVVQTLNSTLVLSEVLEQVLDGVMRITRAERGFLLLAEDAAAANDTVRTVAGLKLRLARRRDGGEIVEARGISKSVVRRAFEKGETVATGDALADPSLAGAQSVAILELRTIVCIPLLSPRPLEGGSHALGAIYADNPETSAAFSRESLAAAEALARHAALAIENAQLFEREQRTNEELRLAQKKLLHSEKLATIGQMAAGIAHELNTPLTYIMGNLELMQSQELSEPQQEMLRSIGRGAERIHNLAQSLLAFSRSAEQPQPIAPNDLVERALELCHYHILKGGVDLRKSLAPSLPRVLGIASQLEMAIINLVVNAIQAMDGEGVLRVTTAQRDSEVEIAVADSGPGVPPEIRDTLFEPFVTTKPAGKGTGLGLSTVLMVVERHRGRVDFTTEAGTGTTFRIRLPAASS